MEPKVEVERVQPAPIATERREHERASAEFAVTMHTKSNFYSGLTENISEGGVFVASEVVQEVGSEITMTIHLGDGGEPLVVVGEVRWLRDCTPRGMGVGFRVISETDRRRIAVFERRRDPLFFED